MLCKLQGLCQCEVAELYNSIPHCLLLDVIYIETVHAQEAKSHTNVRKERPLATRSPADTP